MTGAEVRKLKPEEVKVELARLRNRLYDLRTQSVTDKVANTTEFSTVRKDIARILTERTARHAAKNGAASGTTKTAAEPATKSARKPIDKPTTKAATKPRAKAAPKARAKKAASNK
jgi:ribosomal protein L29